MQYYTFPKAHFFQKFLSFRTKDTKDIVLLHQKGVDPFSLRAKKHTLLKLYENFCFC